MREVTVSFLREALCDLRPDLNAAERETLLEQLVQFVQSYGHHAMHAGASAPELWYG